MYLVIDRTCVGIRPDGTPIAMYSMGGLAQYCVVPTTAVFELPAGMLTSDGVS